MYTPSEKEFGNLVDRPVLSDRVILLRRQGIQLSRNCLESEDIILEEALLDEFFQILA